MTDLAWLQAELIKSTPDERAETLVGLRQIWKMNADAIRSGHPWAPAFRENLPRLERMGKMIADFDRAAR